MELILHHKRRNHQTLHTTNLQSLNFLSDSTSDPVGFQGCLVVMSHRETLSVYSEAPWLQTIPVSCLRSRGYVQMAQNNMWINTFIFFKDKRPTNHSALLNIGNKQTNTDWVWGVTLLKKWPWSMDESECDPQHHIKSGVVVRAQNLNTQELKAGGSDIHRQTWMRSESEPDWERETLTSHSKKRNVFMNVRLLAAGHFRTLFSQQRCGLGLSLHLQHDLYSVK